MWLTGFKGLIKSDKRNEQQEGVQLLSQIFRTASDRRRECLYYIALGNFKLGNYAEARRYNDLLLEHEPDNLQAASLQQLIDDKVAKEGLVGVAIVGGVALAAGLIGGLLVRGSRRRWDGESYNRSNTTDIRRIFTQYIFCSIDS